MPSSQSMANMSPLNRNASQDSSNFQAKQLHSANKSTSKLPMRQISRSAIKVPQSSSQSTVISNSGANQEEELVIHVYDENRNVNRDFKCYRHLLLQNMNYFDSYLKDADNLEDIDIWVHCDINIFDWLMRYIKDVQKPVLDIKNVISIFISSEFLGMQHLVDVCVDFV